MDLHKCRIDQPCISTLSSSRLAPVKPAFDLFRRLYPQIHMMRLLTTLLCECRVRMWLQIDEPSHILGCHCEVPTVGSILIPCEEPEHFGSREICTTQNAQMCITCECCDELHTPLAQMGQLLQYTGFECHADIEMWCTMFVLVTCTASRVMHLTCNAPLSSRYMHYHDLHIRLEGFRFGMQ